MVQATGWGSRRSTGRRRPRCASGRGPTLVVSPLLALMRDQIAAAERAGLARRRSTPPSRRLVGGDGGPAIGRPGLLLVSPERLANPRFAAELPELLASCGLLVIDEAHCVSTGASTSGRTTSGSRGPCCSCRRTPRCRDDRHRQRAGHR